MTINYFLYWIKWGDRLFPEEIIYTEIDMEEFSVTPMGKIFLYNFPNKEFILQNGDVVKAENVDRVKVWVEKILRTQKGKYEIYPSYGVDFRRLMFEGYPLGFLRSEIEREIREAVELNPEINFVDNFVFQRVQRGLECEFTVNTIYGESFQSEVIISE